MPSSKPPVETDSQEFLEYKVTASLVDCKNLLKELFVQGFFEEYPATLKRVRLALSECDTNQQLLANKLHSKPR
jgi:hypothetical protein